MDELNTLLNELIKEKGGSVKDYKNLLKSIAYHESAHTLDPTIKQRGGGPGRGKYQFEEGKNSGGITAARRTKKYFDIKGIKSPKWLDKALEGESLDATKLSSDAQDVLFLGNMRMHPKADFKKVWEGEESTSDFWAKYHWAGSPKDKAKRLKSFETSMKDLETKPTYEIPNNQEFQSNTFESPTMFAQGGNLQSYVKQKFTNKNLNSFNAGGLHETNPHGGIPQGTGSNGQMNTVEQGETSFDLPNGKFIFSDRIDTKGTINQFVDGGPIDPPNKKIESGKEYVRSWFDDSTTKAKLSMNLNQGLKASNQQVQAGLNNLDKVNTRITDPVNDTLTASYTPFDNEISFYEEPNSKVSTHEYTHSMGSIDNDLSTYIKRNYGAIPLDKGKDFNERSHIKYINRQGELYSRVMELREHLGVKPGDEINDDHIKTLKDDNVNELMKYYEPDQIKSMLNTLASNSSTLNVNTAALGGVQDSNCGGPGQPPCKPLNDYEYISNTYGDTHVVNDDKIQESKNRMKDYLNSPGFLRILSKGYDNPEKEKNSRLNKLKNIPVYTKNILGDKPGQLSGLSITHTKDDRLKRDYDYDKLNKDKDKKKGIYLEKYGYKGTPEHEMNHFITDNGKSLPDSYIKEISNRVTDDFSYVYQKETPTTNTFTGKPVGYLDDPTEAHSRIINSRMLLKHAKIWDYNKEDFTKEHLKKLKNNINKYPSKYRLKEFNDLIKSSNSDEDFIWLMNNIASNEKNTKNNLT